MKPWRSGAFDHPGHAHAANWLCAELVGPGYGLEHDLARPVRLAVGPDRAVGVGQVAGPDIHGLPLGRQDWAGDLENAQHGHGDSRLHFILPTTPHGFYPPR